MRQLQHNITDEHRFLAISNLLFQTIKNNIFCFIFLLLAYYYQGIILVYDITRRNTFENIQKWINYVEEVSKNEPVTCCNHSFTLEYFLSSCAISVVELTVSVVTVMQQNNIGPPLPPLLSFMTFCDQTMTQCPLKVVSLCTNFDNYSMSLRTKTKTFFLHQYCVLVSSTGPLSLTTHICPIQHAGKDVKTLIVGNKCDVAENKRTVTFKEGKQVCTSYLNFLYIWQF